MLPHSHILKQPHTHTHTQIHTNNHTQNKTQIRMCAHAPSHYLIHPFPLVHCLSNTHTHTHIHTHTHTHTHTHRHTAAVSSGIWCKILHHSSDTTGCSLCTADPAGLAASERLGQ